LSDWFGYREPQVHGLAWVDEWLHRNLEPGKMKRETEGKVGKRPEAPAPINLAVIVLREELRELVEAWVECACDVLKLAGPREPSLGYRLNWLSANLRRLEDSDGIADMWQEFADWMSHAHAVVPWRASPRLLVGVPCPGCHRRTMVIFGGEIDAQCRVCRTVIPHHTYGLWVKIVTRELKPREAARGKRAGSSRSTEQALSTPSTQGEHALQEPEAVLPRQGGGASPAGDRAQSVLGRPSPGHQAQVRSG
jgi:ribosomal protein S27E